MDPIVLTHKNTAEGCKFIMDFTFRCGHSVPLYDISTTGALNQLIGHAKVANSQYGNVYYRGVDGLYDNVMPSLMRNRTSGSCDDLHVVLNAVCGDAYFHKSLKLRDTMIPQAPQDYEYNKRITRYNKYCVEALLQHYAGSTRFLDVVDNHWVAIWMGAHRFWLHGKGGKFCQIQERKLNIGSLYEEILSTKKADLQKKIYEYIILVAMPYPETPPEHGIIETENLVEVDLRKVFPSFYLRPHAQHALVVRRRDKQNINQIASYYDMASQVVAILRVRIDRAYEWLGRGALLTEDNLFPSPSIDQGYNNLLMHTDIFTYPFEILKYY